MVDLESDSMATVRQRVERLILAAEEISAVEIAALARGLGVPAGALQRGGLQRGDQRLAVVLDYIFERLRRESPVYLVGLGVILELRRLLLPAPAIPAVSAN